MPNDRENQRKNLEKTKPYKVNRNEKRKKPVAKKVTNDKKTKKEKKGKKQGKHPKLMMFIKICIVLFLLLCVIGAGIIAGMFFGLFGEEFEITKDELKIGASNSVIVDKNGEIIANLSGDEKRKIITLEDMAAYLPKAYVAIEDERFYQHSGVDIKRTAGAILHTITGNSSYGGSTITQQLVKNITKEKETAGMAGIMRKVKEWAKAYQVERMISKDEILELYLNILFVGGEGNLHGVELGAEYYFNKSAKDLDLAECAFLAGINTSPSKYNPYDTTKNQDELKQSIKSKVLTVLEKMKELGYIEKQEDYDTAVAKAEAGLTFQKGVAASGTTYSYHTDAVLNQVIEQVMEEKEISRTLAENYVYSSGLIIYSTVDNSIQSRLEQEYAQAKYISSSKAKDANGNPLNDHSQSAMAVIDYKTGYVVGVAGGLGAKEGAGWNRATQMVKPTGSSMKPLAAIAPGLEEKVINAATVYDDNKTNFGGTYEPKNYNRFTGLTNIRSFIATSQNIPALKIVRELTPTKSIEYLRKMGITSLVDETQDAEHNDNGLPIALGGLTKGVSPLEMAAAYGTIANDGVYVTPTFYTKVEDSSGNTVLTPNQQQTRVISVQNAYITKTIVQEPVKSPSGTATYCAIKGIDVAAKTGTTDDDFDRWLCGFTPYYSAACWYGYDNNEKVRWDSNPAGLIWDAVMTDIHANLPNATFTRPDGIVEAVVCKVTGCTPTTGCDTTYTEIFTSDNMPARCQGHGSQQLCPESGKIANEYCPANRKTNVYGAVIPKEQLKLWNPLVRSVSGNKVEEICTIHTKPEEQTNTTNTTPSTNTTNTTPSTNTTNTTPPTNTNTSGNNTTNTNTTPSGGNTTNNNTTNTNTSQNTTGGNTST